MSTWFWTHITELILGAVVLLVSFWRRLSELVASLTGVDSYLRERRKRYLTELTAERNELKASLAKLEEDLEAQTRALDRRVEINRQDAYCIRQFRELCDQHQMDYGHIHLSAISGE